MNLDVKNDPSIINREAEKSWIVSFKIENKEELDELLSFEDYNKFLKAK